MEVKTNKQASSSYRKEDVGQLHNHLQWVKDNHQISEIFPVFVGPLLPASSGASPTPAMKVVELRQFEDLGKRLVSSLQDAASQALPLNFGNVLYEVMRSRRLLYPQVLKSLDLIILQDIP